MVSVYPLRVKKNARTASIWRPSPPLFSLVCLPIPVSISLSVFAFQHGHESQVAVRLAASGRIAHRAFIQEAKALVEMARTSVVFIHVEKEPVRVEFLERSPNHFAQNPVTQAALWLCHHNALQFDGAALFTQPAQDHIGLQLARAGFAHQITRIAPG